MVTEPRCPRCDQLFAPDELAKIAICPYCGFEVADQPNLVVPPPPTFAPSERNAFEPTTDVAGQSGGLRSDGFVTVPRFVIYTQGILLAVIAIVAFVLGAGFGGLYSSQSDSHPNAQVSCEIRGRITRSRIDGQEEGAEARVIFLPADKRPDERWPHDGLRPGQDVPPTDHPALVGIRVLGGGFVTTNTRGEYRLKVPSSGEYHALVLTEATGRRKVTWSKRDLAQVGRYFQDTMKLLGPCEYRWQLLTVRPDERWNVVFPPR